MRSTLARLRRNTLFELAFIVAIAVGLALAVQAFAVRPYSIPSGSMKPTLNEGQRVVVNRFSHRLGAEPKVGQVVVFRPPAGADDEACANPHQGGGTPYPCGTALKEKDPRTFIKRVVAVGGDTIAVRDGHVVRNGRQADEAFIAPCAGGAGCDFPRAIRISPDHVFLMGDNRGESDDSRFWGPIPVDWVIGQAFASYWPPNRVGGL